MLSTACPKPERGERRKELLERRASRRTLEKKAKDVVRTRDGGRCRVPGCSMQKEGWAVHVAHLDAKGLGGDKLLDRTRADRMVCLCAPHHIGERSHHSGDLRIEPTTPAGTSGPCDFYQTNIAKQWEFVGCG